MKILMVLTSHDQLGDTGKKTGYWLEEFAAPYYAFKDAGAEITLASPKGGQPPLDPTSVQPENQTESTKRYDADPEVQAKMAATEKLASVSPDNFDAVFYPGGHGPLWDLAEDRSSIALIENLIAADKPVALVCHAPAALRHAKGQDGKPLIAGRKVTGFSNSEEVGVGLTDAVPYLLEDELKAKGGVYSKAADQEAHVVKDGNLITGQNPKSSAPLAQELLKQLETVSA